MKPTHRAYLFLHVSVILWGFTAILGDLINLNAGFLVWWRVALTSFFLLFWPNIFKHLIRLSWKSIRIYAFIGVLVGVHWVCFFGAVKLANASITLVAVSTVALFTSFLEPFILHTRFRISEFALGIIVIPAMALIVQDFDGKMILGFWSGIAASFLAALFAVLNKKYIDQTEPQVITLIEMSSACVALTVMGPFFLSYFDLNTFIPQEWDWAYLIFLSLGCTILPFVLHLISLKSISAFASNLVMNMEPVYGIVFAIVILKEHKELSVQFYIGVAIILFAIIIYPIINRKRKSELINN